MPTKPKDPCKKAACKIQTCLKENNYQESACVEVLESMRQCCLEHFKESLCCSGINLDKPYVKESELPDEHLSDGQARPHTD